MASAVKSSRDSSNPQQSTASSKLRLEPPNAYFPPPHHTRSIRNTLTLSNVSDASYVFKVRGVRGEAYIVKPTIFVIPPTSAVRLQLTLKKTDMVLNDTITKDRFRITCKMLTNPAAVALSGGSSPDYRAIWDSHEAAPTAAEIDVKCYFGMDVPRGVMLTYMAEDNADVSSTAPTMPPGSSPVAGGVPPLAPPVAAAAAAAVAATPTTTKAGAQTSNPNAKVKFGKDDASAAAATTSPSQAADDPNASKNAAANARRLRETVQQEIELLKKQAAALEAEVAAEKQQEDRVVNEALDLEEQRRRVQDGTAKNQAQRAALESRRSAAPSAATTSGSNVSPAPPGPLQAAPTTASSPLSSSSPVATKKPASKSGSMYLSTVLLWMIVIYLLGILYRIFTIQQGHESVSIDILHYLPQDLQNVILPLRGYLF